MTSDSESGLNMFRSTGRRPEKFLKQRLFDLRQLRDTSRFRSPGPSHRKLLTINNNTNDESASCNHDKRGAPDGEERLEINKETNQEEDKTTLYKLKSDFSSVSSDMKNVMKNARDIRRLIRESSFDSLASDFSLDLDCNLDFKSDNDEEDENDITITDDKEEYVLDKNLFDRFECSQMWRLTNSTRESSLVSDYSYDFKNDRTLRIHGGYTSDDLASLIGSQADALEWDDDCFLEDDIVGARDIVASARHGALLPDYDEELDLESELGLRMMSPPESMMMKMMSPPDETMLMRDKLDTMMTRLPPSGCSSVESLCDVRK